VNLINSGTPNLLLVPASTFILAFIFANIAFDAAFEAAGVVACPSNTC